MFLTLAHTLYTQRSALKTETTRCQHEPPSHRRVLRVCVARLLTLLYARGNEATRHRLAGRAALVMLGMKRKRRT